MSDRSTIEWTDATWNPVRGCTKVSQGCRFCYAEVFSERFRGVPGHPFEQGFDLRLVPEKLEQPLHLRRPRKIIVNSMSDLFHEDVWLLTPPPKGVGAPCQHRQSGGSRGEFNVETARELDGFPTLSSHWSGLADRNG